MPRTLHEVAIEVDCVPRDTRHSAVENQPHIFTIIGPIRRISNAPTHPTYVQTRREKNNVLYNSAKSVIFQGTHQDNSPQRECEDGVTEAGARASDDQRPNDSK